MTPFVVLRYRRRSALLWSHSQLWCMKCMREKQGDFEKKQKQKNSTLNETITEALQANETGRSFLSSARARRGNDRGSATYKWEKAASAQGNTQPSRPPPAPLFFFSFCRGLINNSPGRRALRRELTKFERLLQRRELCRWSVRQSVPEQG